MESTLSSLTTTPLSLKRTSPSAHTLSFFFRPLCLPTSPNSFTSLAYLCPLLPVARSPNPPSAAGDGTDVSALSPDVIVLHVGGMTCGGCAASVKRILETQPQVSSASVNLTTETAIVWPVPESKSFPNWREQLGELLAKNLTSCGFTSNLQDQRAQEGDSEL